MHTPRNEVLRCGLPPELFLIFRLESGCAIRRIVLFHIPYIAGAGGLCVPRWHCWKNLGTLGEKAMRSNSLRVRAAVVPIRRCNPRRQSASYTAAGRVGAAGPEWRGREVSDRVSVAAGPVCGGGGTPRVLAVSGHASVEGLEGRALLSAVWVSNGVLNLAGDAGTGNSLTVDLQSNGGYWAQRQRQDPLHRARLRSFDQHHRRLRK